MALSRRTGQRFQASIWPGFVDAMTGLLLVLMFVLTIFMVIQFVLRETITGQESELDALAAEIVAISEALGLEKSKVVKLESDLGILTSTLNDRNAENEQKSLLIESLRLQNNESKAALDDALTQITQFEVQVANLLAAQAASRTQIDQLETERKSLLDQQEALALTLSQARDEIDLAEQEARLKAAEREALEALIRSLETEKSDANKTIENFINKAFSENINKLIIVTGKGLHSENEKDPYVSKDLGILKYSVPEFINNNASLMKMINEITDAKIEDGGGGAFYIFLKKNNSIK